MMKRKLMRLMALLMALLMMAPAVLAEGSIVPKYDAQENYMRVLDMASVGGEIYILTTGSKMSLWRWREGMEEAELVRDGIWRADNLPEGSVREDSAPDVKYALATIFSDGERLMGVNPASGLVFEIVVGADGVTFRDVVTLQGNERFYDRTRYGSFYASVTATAVSGGYLYWLGRGWDAQEEATTARVTRFSLTDGSAVDLDTALPSSLCAWKDGKVLMIARAKGSDKPYDVTAYDPVDGSFECVGALDTTRGLSRIVYAPELDALIWQEGTNIMGMQAMGPEQLYAYVPANANGEMAVAGDALLFSVPQRTVARQLVPGLTVPQSLQVMHASFDDAAEAFSAQYPDVPLEVINDSAGDEGYDAWLNPAAGMERVDVLRLYTTTKYSDFITLRDEGKLLDLSSDPEIAAWVEGLYPPFRDLVTGENGEIWAVPTETVSYTGFFVNRKAMTDMGFKPEDMPTNLVDLCAFITMWDAEYADRYPNYCCIEYTENTRHFLADMAIHMWIVHCQATGRDLRFDDPEFRKAMDAVATVSTVRTDAGMQVTNPEISDYKSGLFWTECQLVGNWAAYMEPYSDRVFIPLTLTADTPYHAEVGGVELWTVNARTETPDYAMKYIVHQIGQVNAKYAHVLQVNRTEPVESPYYAASLAQEQRSLGQMQMALLDAETPEHEAELRRMIAAQEAYIAGELNRTRYDIFPSAIENYVDVLAPALYIRQDNILENSSEGLRAIEYIRGRWLSGVITTEQFIHEIDARLLMLEMAQ